MWLVLLFSCNAIQEQLGAPLATEGSEEIVFTVPKGTTARDLGALLHDRGLADGQRFEWYVRLSGEGNCLKAGDFRLRADMSAQEILDTVCGAPIPEDVPFTVVEGWRIREIDAALTKQGWIEAGSYAALANDPSQFTASFPVPAETLEGYLFPETYAVSVDPFDLKAFIQRQLDTLAEQFVTQNAEAIAHRSLHDVVIMASMIEREEPSTTQRPLVSGILWKRIDNDWNLGVDATSRYTLENWNDRRAFLANLRDPQEPYNTRMRPGLPPTPIGNAGLESLQAAASPEESPFWYYLHDSTGKLHPSRSAREHESKRRQLGVH